MLRVSSLLGGLLVALAASACSSSSGDASPPLPDAGDASNEPPKDGGADDAPHSPDATRPAEAGQPDAARKDAAREATAEAEAPDVAVDAMLDHEAPVDAADAALDAPSVDAPVDSPIDAPADVGPGDGTTPDAGEDAGTPALRYVGRVDLSDPAGPRFEWSGSEVIADFMGTGLTLSLSDTGNYFDVVIDTMLQTNPIQGAAGTTAYTVASNLTLGKHEVILHRRTEPDYAPGQGFTQVLGASVIDGSLLPPSAAATRRLEVIGDSISCGFGDLGVGPTCDGTGVNEDHYWTYGAVTARDLGAELITTAWSGKGMYENNDGSFTNTMPDYYPYVLPVEGVGTWDFASWQPDAVVINLGTNDFADGDPGPNFETTYLAFLQTVRQNYPNAYIFAAIGPLLEEAQFEAASAYINQAVSALNDPKVSYLSFGVQSGDAGYGCDYHPNVMTQGEMAMTLEGALETALGW